MTQLTQIGFFFHLGNKQLFLFISYQISLSFLPKHFLLNLRDKLFDIGVRLFVHYCLFMLLVNRFLLTIVNVDFQIEYIVRC